MTDTWYVFGAMVADPAFFGEIAKVAGLKFDRITMYVVEDSAAGRLAIHRRAAGYLDGTCTTALRRAFREYVKTNLVTPAPVISLYTAAKFCQLSFTLAGFPQVFAKANAAFKKNGGVPKSSVELLTALGISLLDSGIASTLMVDGTMAADNVPLSNEFHLQDADMKTLNATLHEQDFNDARALLMTAACWTDAPCPEFLGFYEGFKRAVN